MLLALLEKILNTQYQTRKSRPLITMPESRIGRAGCSVLLVMWFTLLLTPCAMFWLASGNEVIFHHADIPDPVFHPLLEIGLVMTADHSGFQVTSSNISSQSETNICVQTSVTYQLWQNRTREELDSVFCDCYTRDSNDSGWMMDVTDSGICESG